MVEICHLWLPKALWTFSILIVLHTVDYTFPQVECKGYVSQNPIFQHTDLWFPSDTQMGDLEGRSEDDEAARLF